MKQISFILIYSSIALFTTVFSCSPPHIFGTFGRLNVSLDYYAETLIILKTDMTFEYDFKAHMAHDHLFGHFARDQDILTLHYDSIITGSMDFAPRKLKFRKNRLYVLDENGKVVVVGKFFHKKKDFLMRIKKPA